MTRIHLHGRARTWLSIGVAASSALALHASAAAASSRQVSLIQDGVALNQNPYGDLAEMKEVGANTVRVLLNWNSVAPRPNARFAPRPFTAANPAAYPASGWSQWDAIVRAAHVEGIRVDLDIIGAPPRWAEARNVPPQYLRSSYGWEPNAVDYGQFVRAVATRYDGHYTPAGQTSPLPRVNLYSLWNEPNNGQDLGPQNIDATKKSAGYLQSPRYYRQLLRTGFSALRAKARGSTILFGELAPDGKGPFHTSRRLPFGLPGRVSLSAPGTFVRTLYCLNPAYKPLTGRAASVAGCPTNARARRSFVRQNPALFDASAFAMHPYASHYTPTAKAKSIPANDFPFPVIGRLESTLTRSTSFWHRRRLYRIWSTEFGYITSPPQTNRGGKPWPSPQQAAIYLNQSEYLSYRNPRIASYAQYLLNDPPNLLSKGVGLFASGLLTDKGVPKPTLFAYRMPIWLPRQKLQRRQNAIIWGGARPAPAGFSATRQPQHIELQQLTGGSWQTLATVTASRFNGDFTTHYRFIRSVRVRLAYTYPSTELALPVGIAGSTIYSRTVPVTVR
ncbi:MAG TPA: hypothetical protein VFN36_03285 [Solirubrobacteraceae bacterium]|nr:hypothetical protein [Solirubrobacteraceae bacterium]